MKRALLISSAAVAITAIAAPIAALDVSVSGRVRVEMTGGDSYKSTLTVGQNGNDAWDSATAALAVSPYSTSGEALTSNGRVDVKVSASTCCLNYGGMVRLDDSSSSEQNIYMSGDWGRLDMGNIENARGGACDTSNVQAGPLALGSGVHGANSGTATAAGVATAASINDFKFDGNAITGSSIRYTGMEIAGLKPVIAVGYDASNDVAWEGNLGYSMELGGTTVSVKLATDSNDRNAARVEASFGDITVGGFMAEDDDDDTYSGGAIKYTMGALSLSAGMSTSEGANGNAAPTNSASEDDIVIGMGYTIAPGLSFGAGYRQNDHSVFGTASDYKARLQLSF